MAGSSARSSRRFRSSLARLQCRQRPSRFHPGLRVQPRPTVRPSRPQGLRRMREGVEQQVDRGPTLDGARQSPVTSAASPTARLNLRLAPFCGGRVGIDGSSSAQARLCSTAGHCGTRRRAGGWDQSSVNRAYREYVPIIPSEPAQ